MNMDATFNLYQRFWNHAQNAIFVVDTNTGLLQDLNPAAESLSGYTKAELLNQSYYCLHPSEEHGRIKSSFTNAFNTDVIAVFQRLAQQVESGLHTLAQQQALNFEHAKVQQAEFQLKQVLTATIGAMAATMESRDPYTSGHQSRVAHLAVAIGQELGWPEDRIRGLKMAAIVHDIGRIGIPIEILTKPSKLSLNERALISEHPSIGYQILKDIPFPWPIADIVHQHHEKIDGSGYPQHLKGDQILPEAQVLAVADIVESMASYRPYREALGIDVALAEIERQAGVQLDAHIVNTTLKLFRDKNFSLPKR